MAARFHPTWLYVATFLLLVALLGVQIGVSYIDIPHDWFNIVAMTVACVRALLIILIFMNIIYEKWITWYFASAGFVWLGILIVLSMNDYLTRNHPANSSPKGEPVFLSPR
ncbi:MAG TPA: cytochrome C oxidase subunit IV family protein [Tepidisphaeraceae bacterium]|nr:cytochrome C oxidase subunit IV family protein [Tepidisphaeraceae bacterium]